MRFGSTVSALLVAETLVAAAPVGEECLPCHAEQVNGYARTAMAHSISHSAAIPSGSYTHQPSGTAFTIHPSGIRIERGGISAAWAADYVIGSGSHAFGIIVRVGEYLFQAPVSYFVARAAWGVAPGFESAPLLDFTRPVTPECLECHADRPRPISGTLNRYQNPPLSGEAISCDRCHGDSAAHLKNPARGNIVNPESLPARARDSICEQCHVSGEARILNPGRAWSDFRPGDDLEKVFSVYVRADERRNSIKVISHTEQLALSRCARASGEVLWCGSCHNPHFTPSDPVRDYRDRCLSCHRARIANTHSDFGSANCIGCHMAKRETIDGAHTVFTDHRILRNAAQSNGSDAPVTKLHAWHEPPREFALRNLGLANIAAGIRLQSNTLIGEGANQIQEALRSYPRDIEMLAQYGVVLLRARRIDDAIRTFSSALAFAPDNAILHVDLGDAYREAGGLDRSAAELNRALEIDPSLLDAWRSLEMTYIRANDGASARRTLERYLEFMPKSMAARTALGAR